ncbi:cobalt-precorrin-6A reductase [Xenorhabdus nematophila]|uniref:Cobalt-precorrin-6A reductase n=1 Tax=Xenorhabdus nematophila (strain ATCC 19061 / DSM 3370 / CCUG 14189 / LMG 1036 / NCIMB 9965 / AN6) TaxID=406817 RepID=D3V931_XENNA|nr:cobalt-precorrin-6A reductase [Xenorhabdus nematophila]CEE93992.1 Cobalt-precorrin-6A reductase [Xenorhabdus nematophila str. Anatoliense]CEF30759.1 Cobalt-precorrin-6A reductase [Xenorhabdus nematophila str. Websteri]AYA40815.1 cobalt-precorrin-6A reductase [Xenorhabdus nematophila]MBA0019565.1 cobalt-precorrin-6A reductase [Xenorhabdus nematophila]MCB4423921.1 cobalt-precorrin-6A reductase [Xenorhabdus nematophila]
MKRSPIHIFGGTSDARQICAMMDIAGIDYCLSVATLTGAQQAREIGGEIVIGRMESEEMAKYLQQRGTRVVIDASHPYAERLSQNIVSACQKLGIPLIRYVRPSDIDVVEHPLIHKVTTIEQACEAASGLGARILLTTGSKQLADYLMHLKGKTVLARVLPTAEVLAMCEACDLSVDQIFALKGPFSADFNRAFYQFCQAEVVITKESGEQGGFKEKIEPCLSLGLPCIVICRPSYPFTSEGITQVNGLEEMERFLTRKTWQG